MSVAALYWGHLCAEHLDCISRRSNLPLLNRKPVPDNQYSTSDDDSDNNTKTIENGPVDTDDDDLLSDLDLTPSAEAETDAEIMAALDSEDEAAPNPVVPADDWLAAVQELARLFGPFSPAQILQIVRELDVPGNEAGR
jgi:hypothetical protein